VLLFKKTKLGKDQKSGFSTGIVEGEISLPLDLRELLDLTTERLHYSFVKR